MADKNFPKILRKGIYRNNIEDERGIEVARVGLFALNDDSDPAAEALRDEIVDRYNMKDGFLAELSRLEDRIERMNVVVEVRNVYGNEMIYPANFEAERFAAIAGKKTLSRTDLMNIKALGFVVEEVAVKKLAA